MDITEKQQLLFHLNAVLVANSILMYDHIVTLPEELAFIWRRPKLLSPTLFLANRYVALVGNIFGLFIDFLPAVSDESCSRYMLVRELFLYLQQIIVCVILTLRIYALYGRSRRLLGYIVIIGLALMGGASAGSFGNNSNTAIYIQGSDCHNTFTAKIAMRYGLAWIAVFVFELLIFVLTVFRTCKTRGSPRLIPSSRNIIDIIFRDGAMYFAAMTLINLPNILTYYCGSVSTHCILQSGWLLPDN
ncbi:uncharacterized protein F5147DRAFT_715732 [Suillus discolor]|uniref:DUF6533 domain-containing protein n=1 Tax=Suillus discolor TaxID=1912936 RepID=A0A9P7EZ23_9AGAM|nr:uncharacterized protein F5147DRAFT_715732 [Suillus discolor]KAG2097010.1 hypothetical protein F5147DRAFT_715732 [Suillus discolor]